MKTLPELDASAMTRLLTRDDNLIHLVGMCGRPGVMALAAVIEWTWFQPGTPKNDLYNIHGTEWEGPRWLVISFPSIKIKDVAHVVKQLGMRIANGVPATFFNENRIKVFASTTPDHMHGTGIIPKYFPGSILPNGKDNRSVRHVENRHASPVYRNRRRDHETMLSAESEIVGVLNRGVSLTPAQIVDYIYGLSEIGNADA